MITESPKLIDEAVRTMSSSEPIAALSAVQRLYRNLWDNGRSATDLTGMWTAFKKLLERRGYHASTPGDLAGALNEIYALGEGFDLFNLAQALAELDTTQVECLKLAEIREFPDLKRFAPRCPCDVHPKAGP